MSYTIQATPPSLSSVHGDLIWTVAYPEHTADPVTYPNFKFVGDLYINGVLEATIKKVPDPVTNIGIFNMGQIIRSYLETTFNPTAATFLAQTLPTGAFNIKVTMKFGEEYSYTTYTNLLLDSERTYFNNYNSRLTGISTSLYGYSNKPLTTRPYKTFYWCDGANNFIPYFPTSTSPFTITVTSYDPNGTLWNQDTEIITPANANDCLIFNCSPAAINQAIPLMIDDFPTYYTIEFGAGGEVYRFDKKCECAYEVFTLHFLNKFGGFESKEFTKVSRKTIQIEKKDFGKLPYTVDSSGFVSYKNTNNVYNESRSTYSSQFQEKMVLNSDFITDEEYLWLEELVLSPLVYVEQDGYFFPVTITETDYEPKKYINDELTNLTLSIEFGGQYSAQYR